MFFYLFFQSRTGNYDSTIVYMKKLNQNWHCYQSYAWKNYRWAQISILILLLLGIFFRFDNLGRKVYWYDETITSLRVSGYRQIEVIRQLFDGHEVSVEDLQKYQRLSPKKSLIATAHSLASEAPQHPPLYYVMARVWMQWFGNSVAVLRSLSALISLLAFPCLYWLCLELFESSIVGWIAIALMAVSPFYVLYAQEAREYSLWTVTILLSTAALLRAMRLNTKLSWLIYAATLAVGLYSFTFSLLIAIGHAIYVAAIEGLRLTKTVNAFLLASFASLLVFVPWLLVIIIHLLAVHEISAWTNFSLPLLTLVKGWLLNLSQVFFDLNVDYTNPLIYSIVPVLALEAYSIYFICRKAPKRVWLLILTLIGVTALALILPDLFFGGRRSSISRYLTPCYSGVQLAVAYLITTQIIFNRSSQQKIWQVVLVVLISGGIVSCTLSSQAEAWWNKYESCDNLEVAQIINRASRPLLISDSGTGFSNVFSLSYLLAPKVRLQLVVEPNIPKVPSHSYDIFLYRTSDSLREHLEKEYKIEAVFKNSNILKLEH